MKTLRIKAAAKLNFSLDILGIRPDGYHEMDMVMQTIDLFDDAELSKAGTISVFSDGSPDGPENLAWKAAEAFFRAAKRSGGARIRLTKRIPAQAGMAGGSADAAAVLIGLNALYDARLSPEALRDAGLSVGADVPYCLIGGTARVRGIGEIVEPMPLFLSGYLVVAKPAIGISTAGIHDPHWNEVLARYSWGLITASFGLPNRSLNTTSAAARPPCPSSVS